MQDDVIARLERIEQLLREQRDHAAKEHYSVAEFARRVGRGEYTVREWCRLGRIAATKRRSGRGRYQEWTVPHAEVQRYEAEGLLPEHRTQRGARLIG